MAELADLSAVNLDVLLGKTLEQVLDLLGGVRLGAYEVRKVLVRVHSPVVVQMVSFFVCVCVCRVR